MKRLLQDRKTLYLVLTIVVISVFTLSIAYAAMSAVLEIHGNSEVVASSWDIHLDNIKVKSGSVSANAPQISGTSSVGFNVELNTPGEFYEFTVDVVNDGTIDAMIDSVVKTPNLTSEQAKYIKYEITYENGESISTKQTLKKGTSTPVNVRVEYRKDISSSDLPSSATELSLKLTLVYVQSDGSGSSIPNNGTKLVNVVSGDGTQVGNEVCIKEECFYVISSTDSTVTMLSKYNLHVGNSVDEDMNVTPLASPTGIQDKTAIGGQTDSEGNIIGFPWIGVTTFSNTDSTYSGSIVGGYVNNYNSYLITQGVTPIEVCLITYEELESLGCSKDNKSCSEAPDWVYAASYWSGSAADSHDVWRVASNAYFNDNTYKNDTTFGVRPVITISRDYL